MGVLALSIPFLHRFGELTGPIAISLSELFGTVCLTYYVGRDAGLHLQYFAATAAFFVIMGLERLKLIAAFVLICIGAAPGVLVVVRAEHGPMLARQTRSSSTSTTSRRW